MDRLILIRHGVTTAARAGVMHGWSDHPLSAEGRAQARAVAERLAHRRPGHDGHGAGEVDHLWTSTLPRALETAAPIEAALGIEATRSDDLRELHLGAASGGTEAELWAHVATAAAAAESAAAGGSDPVELDPVLAAVSGVDFPDGENAADFVRRVDAALAALSRLPGTVAVVSHGVWIMVAVGRRLGTDLGSWPTYRTDNATVTELAGEPASLVRLNDARHLAGPP